MIIFISTLVHSFQSKTLVFYDQEGSLGLYRSKESDLVKKSDSGQPNFRLIYSAISGTGNTVAVVNKDFNEMKSLEKGASVVWSDIGGDFGDVPGKAGKELGELRVCFVTEGGGGGGPHVSLLSKGCTRPLVATTTWGSWSTTSISLVATMP